MFNYYTDPIHISKCNRDK